jgi:hypothetical protein
VTSPLANVIQLVWCWLECSVACGVHTTLLPSHNQLVSSVQLLGKVLLQPHHH